MRRAGTSAAHVLGSAPAGSTERRFPPLDPDENFWFEARRQNGQPIAGAFGGRSDYGRITYDVVCGE